MHTLVNRAAMAGMVAGALALGGCATVDSVNHAQATADSALSQAQAAGAAAQRAQGTADAAGQKADQANTAVQTVDAKVEHFIDEERAENSAERHRHHHHHRYHVKKTGEAAEPATK
jgi:hypothetical protein